MSKDEIIDQYQSANLYVAPSTTEGMSMAVLESLSYGQYVITTPVGQNRELIKEHINGELMTVGDHHELFNMIQKYYEEKFLKNYLVPAKTMADLRIKYNWSNIVKSYDKVLQEVVN